MPECIKNTKKKYKGTEPSPKGLGYCAAEEKVNTRKKGRDNNYWIIKETKTGVKRWVKQKAKTPKNATKLPINTFNILYKLTNVLRKELKKIDVNVYVSKLKKINNMYIMDYIYTDKEIEPYIIVVLKLNQDNTFNFINNEINIQHSGLKYGLKNKVDNIFKKMFKNKYNWDKKQTSTINITI